MNPTKIMVVEDEIIIAMDICNQLERFGYEVVATAISGDQAILEATNHKPEIAIMDIVLKGRLDGISTAQTITKLLNIPVIFLTAYSDPATLNRAKISGATSYLNKPFRPDELRACIEIAIHKHRLERKLKESEQWFAKTLNCISDAVIATDAQGKIRFMNPVAESLTDIKLEQAQGKNSSNIMTLASQKDQTIIENPLQIALKTYSVTNLDGNALLITKSGKEVPIESSAAIVLDNDEALLGAVLIFRDITQRRLIENLLQESEELFHGAFNQAAIGMTLVAVNGRFLQVNNSLCDIFGYSQDELLTMHLYVLVYQGEDNAILNYYLHQLLSDEIHSFQIEMQCIHKTAGKQVSALFSGSLVRNSAGKPQYFIIQIQDISERKYAQQQLTYLANHDPLTGLLNRQQFHNRLTESLSSVQRHNRKLALLYLDLDRFKLINDTLGHEIGDLLLTAVGERLKSSVRNNDILARLGGDEFIVLLSDIEHIEDIARIAQKTIELLNRSFFLENNDIVVNASIGISVFPDDGNNGQTLMMNADSAMYLAKERGKNNYQFYTREMTERAKERMTIERGLRYALTNNEFMLFYQPQIDLTGGHTISCEALIRWQQPDGEIITPNRFIDVSEETGLIVPIGIWALRTACLQAKAWKKNKNSFNQIAVNVSARQFLEHDLYQVVKGIVEETGLSPSAVELEITESAVMHDPKRTLQVLQQLHSLGVRLSIDDFGTGYSSLNYLRYFPIHSVKIDRSFVQDIPHDKGSMALVRAIIALAQELEMEVVAEGVETQEQLAFLKKHQCNKVQGYLFCQPATPEQLEKNFDKAAVQALLFGKND